MGRQSDGEETLVDPIPNHHYLYYRKKGTSAVSDLGVKPHPKCSVVEVYYPRPFFEEGC